MTDKTVNHWINNNICDYACQAELNCADWVQL